MMDINAARRIIAARMAASRRNQRTAAELEALVAATYIEVYPNEHDAAAAIRDRKQQHTCAGGCGRLMNSDTLVVQPVNFTNPDAEHVVVKKDHASTCTDCFTSNR